MDFDAIVVILTIFTLRVLNNSMGTLRVIVMTSGHRTLSFVLAFMESIIFAYTAGTVLTDLNNIPNLIAYAGGFAVGNYFGILIEERFITGYITTNIISAAAGQEIAQALRDAGFGVTTTVGVGVSGNVTVLRSVIDRKQVRQVMEIAQKYDPKAFITTEEAKAVRSGWVQESKKRQWR